MVDNDNKHPLRVLTLGDGDLSFSLALLRCFGQALALTATTFLPCDGVDGVVNRYQSAATNLQELQDRGGRVLHEIDACCLSKTMLANELFDIIIFNYPHLGGVAKDAGKPDSEHVRAHQSLLAHFLYESRNLLASDFKAQVHVTLCGEQAELWRLHQSASRAGLKEIQHRATTDVCAFRVGDSPLPNPPAPSAGATWGARRKWRNGSLGPVHWASRYGYEHRRHESEQSMTVDGSTAFIFAALSSATDEVSRCDNTLEHLLATWRCYVCDIEFESDEELQRHLRAPAAPLAAAHAEDNTSTKRWSCDVCAKLFRSAYALEQHCQSCQRSEALLQEHAQGSKTVDVLHTAIQKRGHGLTQESVVSSEHAGLRFARYAQLRFPRHLTSKAIARRAAANGDLTLNGVAAEDSRILNAGDTVSYTLSEANYLKGGAEPSSPGVASLVHVVVAGGESQNTSKPGNVDQPQSFRWYPVMSSCPPGAAVVWKPSGLRSRGDHAHTLQSALRYLPGMPLPTGCKPLPLSRLEIGLAGLSLIAFESSALQLLPPLVASGQIRHTFRAVVHGIVGDVDSQIIMACDDSADGELGLQATSPLEDEAFVEPDLMIGDDSCRTAQLDKEVVCNVLSVDVKACTSVVELETGLRCGKCLTSLCWMLRSRGTPVVGDRYAKRALSGTHAAGGKRAEGRVAGAQSRRGLQFICVRIHAVQGSLPLDQVLDVRMERVCDDA